jgi:hypothetical protein
VRTWVPPTRSRPRFRPTRSLINYAYAFFLFLSMGARFAVCDVAMFFTATMQRHSRTHSSHTYSNDNTPDTYTILSTYTTCSRYIQHTQQKCYEQHNAPHHLILAASCHHITAYHIIWHQITSSHYLHITSQHHITPHHITPSHHIIISHIMAQHTQLAQRIQCTYTTGAIHTTCISRRTAHAHHRTVGFLFT